MSSEELKHDVDQLFDVFIEMHLRAEALSELVVKINEKVSALERHVGALEKAQSHASKSAKLADGIIDYIVGKLSRKPRLRRHAR